MDAALRPWARSDAAALLRALGTSPDLDQQLRSIPTTIAEAEDLIAGWAPAEHQAHFAIALEGRAVGDVELGHRTNNPASCRVALAAGFAAEGIERQKLSYGPDRFDVETHARLRTDPEPASVTPMRVIVARRSGDHEPLNGDSPPDR